MEKNNNNTTTSLVAKRLWKIVRIVYFMIRKGISKNKFMVHLHNIMSKRGAGNLVFHHDHDHDHDDHPTTCRSHNRHPSFVVPRHYEFSCNSSPAASYSPFHVNNNKRKTHRHRHFSFSNQPENDITTIAAIQKILEMLNGEVVAEGSPALPGFGRSPMGRKLRITDSPYPLRDVDEDSHVDRDAEEFIERFYAQLRLQKSMA